MNKQDLLILYRYNAWSNAKILDAASQITAEQFLAPVSFPYGSLRGTLVHALFAEWIWRTRWEGTPYSPAWKPEDFPTLDALQARWAYEEAKLMKFVQNVTDEGLYLSFHYISTEGEPHERVLWETMAHLVNHGTQHKTEAAAILTGFGHSPGDIDLIVYFNEAS
jgi:uncharacterized damage-inducible protein DinB